MCGSGLPPREEALMLAAELLVLERDVRQRAVAAPDALRDGSRITSRQAHDCGHSNVLRSNRELAFPEGHDLQMMH